METRKLYHGNDFIIVDVGSIKERDLLAAGWKSEAEKAAKPKSQASHKAANSGKSEPENTGDEDIPPAA